MASRLRLKKQKGPKGYLAERINRANSVAIGRLFSVEPTFVDVETAINVIPGMTKHTILHSSPL